MTRGGFLAAVLGAPWLAWVTKYDQRGKPLQVIEPGPSCMSSWPIQNADCCATITTTGTTDTVLWLNMADHSWSYTATG